MCVRSRTPWVSPAKFSYEAGSFSHRLNPTGVFSQRFEASFPCAGALGCVVCLTSQLFLLVYLPMNVGPPALPATILSYSPAATLPQILSAQLPISTPSTSTNGCFYFNSLIVRLPYSLIFRQFWLFFVFKFVVVLLLVMQRGTVYLPMPPSCLEVLLRLCFRTR